MFVHFNWQTFEDLHENKRKELLETARKKELVKQYHCFFFVWIELLLHSVETTTINTHLQG